MRDLNYEKIFRNNLFSLFLVLLVVICANLMVFIILLVFFLRIDFSKTVIGILSLSIGLILFIIISIVTVCESIRIIKHSYDKIEISQSIDFNTLKKKLNNWKNQYNLQIKEENENLYYYYRFKREISVFTEGMYRYNDYFIIKFEKRKGKTFIISYYIIYFLKRHSLMHYDLFAPDSKALKRVYFSEDEIIPKKQLGEALRSLKEILTDGSM